MDNVRDNFVVFHILNFGKEFPDNYYRLLPDGKFAEPDLNRHFEIWRGACSYATKSALSLAGNPDSHQLSGRQRLSVWFGLSYASWLTLPRVLMEAMPDRWQETMADLLEQYDEEFPNQPDLGTRVQTTHKKKLVKCPEWLINYRRPNRDAIAKLRSSVQAEVSNAG